MNEKGRKKILRHSAVYSVVICLIAGCTQPSTESDGSQRMKEFLGPHVGVTYTYTVDSAAGLPPSTLKVKGMSCEGMTKCRVRETMTIPDLPLGEHPAVMNYDLIIEAGSMTKRSKNLSTILLKSPLRPDSASWEVRGVAMHGDNGRGHELKSRCSISHLLTENFKNKPYEAIVVECLGKEADITLRRRMTFASGIGLLRIVESVEGSDGKPLGSPIRTQIVDITYD